MLKVSKVKDLPINLKPSVIKDIYEKGHKLLLHFEEDTILGDVSDLADVTDGDLSELGINIREEDVTFKKGLKAVNGKVVISGGESLVVQRFLYEDGKCSLGVIMPCLGGYGKYELVFDLYGTGDTYKMVDSVEEVIVSDCSLRGRGYYYNYLEGKVEILNSIISSGYAVIDYSGKCVSRFLVDIEETTGDVRLLASVDEGYMQCISKGSVFSVVGYVVDVLSSGMVIHLEDLE